MAKARNKQAAYDLPLMPQVARLSEDPKCSDLEVYFLSKKFDQNGEKVVRDGMWVVEVRPIGIHLFDEGTRAFLKQEYDNSSVLSILVLWTRYGAGKLGILKLKPVRDDDIPVTTDYYEWEGKAIAAYLHRHNL